MHLPNIYEIRFPPINQSNQESDSDDDFERKTPYIVRGAVVKDWDQRHSKRKIKALVLKNVFDMKEVKSMVNHRRALPKPNDEFDSVEPVKKRQKLEEDSY